MSIFKWFKNLFKRKEDPNGYHIGYNYGITEIVITDPKKYQEYQRQQAIKIADITFKDSGILPNKNKHTDREFLQKISRDYEKKKTTTPRRRKLPTSRRNTPIKTIKPKLAKRTKKAKSWNS